MIEDVATRLHNAKMFQLDVRNGFWHVHLDEESSFLTTFHTPFGQYRWRRLPFGISSALEVFQRRMHEVIEGLTSVKGAMSQETGLEVPRCWPQYIRMFLVRAICIEIDSVGALS